MLVFLITGPVEVCVVVTDSTTSSLFSSFNSVIVELLLLGYNKELIGNKCSTFSKWAWYFKQDICEKTIMLDHVTGEIYYEGLNTTL